MDQSGLTLREKQARRVKRGSVFDQSVFRLWPNCEAKLQSQATEQCVCSFSSSDHRTLLVDGFRTSPDFRLYCADQFCRIFVVESTCRRRRLIFYQPAKIPRRVLTGKERSSVGIIPRGNAGSRSSPAKPPRREPRKARWPQRLQTSIRSFVA